MKEVLSHEIKAGQEKMRGGLCEEMKAVQEEMKS